MIQLTLEALRQMIEDASTQAASSAVAQYVAEHAVPPQPLRHPGRGHGVDLAPGNNEHGPTGQKARDQLEEEVESRPSLPEDELSPPPPREAPPEEDRSQRRGQVAPPRCSPFAAHILAEAVQPGIKIPNISEYDETKDPKIIWTVF
ncbi:UNVERIFIED_CONTAM: hypothetical protein Slati_2665100 [Sesamum latifolium]|uniref:Uncharacterized protein n=1 Tax=Sesamum latifolium TaxID=2727402 RepID=A0AAW2VVT4_9LAMI